MNRNSEKTIAYRLSPAELENLQLLRKRMNPSTSVEPEEREEKALAGHDEGDTDPGRLDPKVDH